MISICSSLPIIEPASGRLHQGGRPTSGGAPTFVEVIMGVKICIKYVRVCISCLRLLHLHLVFIIHEGGYLSIVAFIWFRLWFVFVGPQIAGASYASHGRTFNEIVTGIVQKWKIWRIMKRPRMVWHFFRLCVGTRSYSYETVKVWLP